jgi:trehalose 6-phosphate synthase
VSRLVAVSNRVGSVRDVASVGGLAVALFEALRERGGLWLGYSSKATREPTDTPRIVEDSGLTLATLDLPADEHEGYYYGYSNRCLWPICHYRPDLVDFRRADFQAYCTVNRRFARALAPLLRPDDLIWAHDYHLFPLASELRKLGVRQRIGFFLHIPFPPADLLAALPEHMRLLRNLFDYDLVGFQTELDLRHFGECVERLAGGVAEGQRVRAFEREIRAGAFPIGIDAREFRELAVSLAGTREFTRMREALRGHTQIIGVDRLDYSKGILRRMRAVDTLFDRYPSTHRQLEYLQIAPLSRRELKAYEDFRHELELEAAHINGRFGTFDWTPVRYLNQPLPRRTLAGLYRASRSGLVTPLRDGMNLVAKEYVAAQDPEDPGILVLSRFAGAARQMRDALQVNPYDTEEVADAIERARTMPLEERIRRHERLMETLQREDVACWREQFLGALAAPAQRASKGGAKLAAVRAMQE